MKPERPEPEEHWQNRQADEQHRQEESFISSNLPVMGQLCPRCQSCECDYIHDFTMEKECYKCGYTWA